MKKAIVLAACSAALTLLSTSAMAWSTDAECKPNPYHPDCGWYLTKYHLPPKPPVVTPPVVTPAPATSWSNNFTAAPVVTSNFTSNPVTTVAPVTKQSQWQTQDANLNANLNQSGSQVGTGGSVKGSGNSTVDLAGVGSNNGSTVNAIDSSSNRSYAIAFSIPAHAAANAPVGVASVGAVLTGKCIAKMDEYGNFVTRTFFYPEPTEIAVPLKDGGFQTLKGIAKKVIVVGQEKVLGFGADVETGAKNKSASGGLLSLFLAGGDSTADSKGITGFKSDSLPCDYEINYYKLAEPVVGQPAKAESDILTIKEVIEERPKAPRIRATAPGGLCNLKNVACFKENGAPGKLSSKERTFDCLKPASSADASLCTGRKSQVGKPAIVEEKVLN